MAAQTAKAVYERGSTLKLHVIESCLGDLKPVQLTKEDFTAGAELMTPEFEKLRISRRAAEPSSHIANSSSTKVKDKEAANQIEKSENIMMVGVQDSSHPSNLWVIMRVRIRGYPHPAILKLYDRRYVQELRISDSLLPWDQVRESIYHDFISSGEAENFTKWLNTEDSSNDSKDPIWTIGHEEAFMQDKCRDFYDEEVAVYHALLPLQNRYIPKLLATVTFQPFPDASAEVQKYTAIYGTLCSYTSGPTLDHMTYKVPCDRWNGVCEGVIRAVDACSDFGVLMEGIKPEHCVVRCFAKAGQPEKIFFQPVIVNFSTARRKRSHESDEDWTEKKKQFDEAVPMGAVLTHHLKRTLGSGGVVYKRSKDRNAVTDKKGYAELLAAPDHTNRDFDMWTDSAVPWGQPRSPVHPQAFLVDEHDDFD